MKRLIDSIAAMAAIAVFLSGASALAQGAINVFACDAYKGPLTVRIDLLDDAAPMLEIRDTLMAALRQKGIAIKSDAPLVLAIEVERTRIGERRKGRDLGSISDGTDVDEQARMNMWSNRQDSVLGGRKDAIISGSEDEVRVSIFINRESDGRCIWRGDATHDTAGRDQWKVADQIVPVLVNAIGEGTGRIEFDLNN